MPMNNIRCDSKCFKAIVNPGQPGRVRVVIIVVKVLIDLKDAHQFLSVISIYIVNGCVGFWRNRKRNTIA